MYRLLVTGGRDLRNAEVVWTPLWVLLNQKMAMIVMHGACPTGADMWAHEWFGLDGQSFNEPDGDFIAVENPHPADWDGLGKAAGHIRNQTMIDLAPDVVFAFPTPMSQGTLDCMARAWVRGIPVYVWNHFYPGHFHMLSEREGETLARRKLHWPAMVG